MLMKIQPLISCRILDRYILHGITPILPIVRCVYVAVYGVVYHGISHLYILGIHTSLKVTTWGYSMIYNESALQY